MAEHTGWSDPGMGTSPGESFDQTSSAPIVQQSKWRAVGEPAAPVTVARIGNQVVNLVDPEIISVPSSPVSGRASPDGEDTTSKILRLAVELELHEAKTRDRERAAAAVRAAEAARRAELLRAIEEAKSGSTSQSLRSARSQRSIRSPAPIVGGGNPPPLGTPVSRQLSAVI